MIKNIFVKLKIKMLTNFDKTLRDLYFVMYVKIKNISIYFFKF